MGEPPEPSHEELGEMLSEYSLALSELAKQPNIRIKYGLPPSFNEKRAGNMLSVKEVEDPEEDRNAKPNYILIYTGHDRR